MLHSLFLPFLPVTIADKDLETCINSCINVLASHLSPETISQTLDQFELGLSQYAKKHQTNIFRMLNAKQTIKSKNKAFLHIMGSMIRDISGVTTLLRHYRELYMAGKMSNVASYTCPERCQPLLGLMKNVLNEMIRINAYKDDIKDVLKQQIGILYIATGHFHFCTKNYEASIHHLQQKITIADSIATESLRESLLDVSDVFTLTIAYTELNDLSRVASILRLERERCITEGPELYHKVCSALASKYSAQHDLSRAIAWYQEAQRIIETPEVHRLINSLRISNINSIVEYLRTIDKKFSLMLAPPEQPSSQFMMYAADYSLTLAINIPEWSPEQIARLKRQFTKLRFDFAAEKLIIHKLSSVGIDSLTSVINSMTKMEREYHKQIQRSSSSTQTEDLIEALQSSIAALAISGPVSDISIASSSSSATLAPSCSYEPIAEPIKKPAAAKLKTRGKPHKNGRHPTTVKVVEPSCDAVKYGFSRELFGQRKFHACGMRGDQSRVFYVVEDKIVASNKRQNNHHAFASLIAEPKIVPPIGEEGFKWMKVDGKQVLVGKVLGTKRRLFPTLAQRNQQGAIAYLYGSILNTNHGIPKHTVPHYMPAIPKLKK